MTTLLDKTSDKELEDLEKRIREDYFSGAGPDDELVKEYMENVKLMLSLFEIMPVKRGRCS